MPQFTRSGRLHALLPRKFPLICLQNQRVRPDLATICQSYRSIDPQPSYPHESGTPLERPTAQVLVHALGS